MSDRPERPRTGEGGDVGRTGESGESGADLLEPQVRRWLDQPTLGRLWDAARDRLARNGRTLGGRLRFSEPTEPEREALSLLLGRPLRQGTITIALSELDTVLRASAAGRGLVEVTTALRGPVVDRTGQRQERAEAWSTVWSRAAQALDAHELARARWPQRWLEEARGGGALTRLGSPRADEVLQQAVTVLATLLPDGVPAAGAWGGRGELAERFTGTAHGLDDDTVLARLVLRGLAHAYGQAPPGDPRARRDLWEQAGISPDTVSTTALTYALAPDDESWLADLLRQRAEHRAETHLTLRDLRRTRWRMPPGTTVFVCENPRVVEAAAEAGCQRPMVCGSGYPTHTVLTLLDALVSGGATLVYRGDFDWPGVAIANRIIGRYGARPWRMGASDYEVQVARARARGTPLRVLSGEPTPSRWDDELTAAMTTIGVAVHEESVLDLLLADLSDPHLRFSTG